MTRSEFLKYYHDIRLGKLTDDQIWSFIQLIKIEGLPKEILYSDSSSGFFPSGYFGYIIKFCLSLILCGVSLVFLFLILSFVKDYLFPLIFT